MNTLQALAHYPWCRGGLELRAPSFSSKLAQRSTGAVQGRGYQSDGWAGGGVGARITPAYHKPLRGDTGQDGLRILDSTISECTVSEYE